MKRRISQKLLIILTAVVIIAVPTVYAINTVLEGFRSVTDAGEMVVDAPDVCKKVTNTSGEDYFIPTKTISEWAAFRGNLPTNVSLSDCVAVPLEAVINIPTGEPTVIPTEIPFSGSALAFGAPVTPDAYSWRRDACNGPQIQTAQWFVWNPPTRDNPYKVYLNVQYNGEWSTNCPFKTVTRTAFAPCSEPDIVLGTQVWSACNLMRNNVSYKSTGGASPEGWPYGYLYELNLGSGWDGTGQDNICPSGYHIPSTAEWKVAAEAAGDTWWFNNDDMYHYPATNLETILKLPRPGWWEKIYFPFGGIIAEGAAGWYWTSDFVAQYGSAPGPYASIRVGHAIVGNILNDPYVSNNSELYTHSGDMYSIRCIRD